MKNSGSNTVDPTQKTEENADVSGYRIGRVAPAENRTTAKVQWDNHPPVAARHLSNVPLRELTDPENVGREVLLLFLNNDPEQPVVIGYMGSLVDEIASVELPEEDKTVTRELIKGEEVITIESDKELNLVCGKSRLTLKKDGEIILKGTKIKSRASEVQEIKGAKVLLN
jgi:hypothetical protein